MTPIPIQRSRKRGAKHPKGTLFVDRTNKDFGNPHRVVEVGFEEYVVDGNTFYLYGDAARAAVMLFRGDMAKLKRTIPKKYAAMMERVRAAPYIACYCPVTDPDCYCHRSVLIALAAEQPNG